MNEEKNPSCKVVLMGNSGVGKTSLINRWTTGVWSRSVKPTIGANHQKKTVRLENKSVDVFVWDTAGQEQFQSLTPLYARSSSCAIIICSINDRSSFDTIASWIDLVRSACEKMPPVLLAVNKNDLANEAVYSNQEIEQKYGKDFVATFFVSAQTGENIDGLFLLAAKIGDEFTQGYKMDSVTIKSKNSKSDSSCC